MQEKKKISVSHSQCEPGSLFVQPAAHHMQRLTVLRKMVETPATLKCNWRPGKTVRTRKALLIVTMLGTVTMFLTE